MCRRSFPAELPSQASEMHGRSDQASLSLAFFPVWSRRMTVSCRLGSCAPSEQPELITKETHVNRLRRDCQRLRISPCNRPDLRSRAMEPELDSLVVEMPGAECRRVTGSNAEKRGTHRGFRLGAIAGAEPPQQHTIRQGHATSCR